MKRLSYIYLLLLSLNGFSAVEASKPLPAARQSAKKRSSIPKLEPYQSAPPSTQSPNQLFPQFADYFTLREVDHGNPEYRQKLIICLAKINAVCDLNGAIDFYDVDWTLRGKIALFQRGATFHKEGLSAIAQKANTPIIFADISGGKTTFGLFPYFFKEIRDRKSVV
jgi:hypothetical protein